MDHDRDNIRIVFGEYGCIFQEIQWRKCSVTYGGSHGEIGIINSGHCVDRSVEVIFMGGGNCFDPLLCCGDMR